MPTITYANELDLSVDDFIAVLNSSGLATRRPVNNRPRLAKMLEKADLTVVARDETGKIVGVARSITDWSYCLYCSDLAVDKDYQGLGIGKKTIGRNRPPLPRSARPPAGRCAGCGELL